MLDDRITPKVKLETEIRLRDGSKLLANLFVQPQSRISDLLNDEREFLPVELVDGRTTVLRKAAIMQVTPMEQQAPVYQGSDPYEILGMPAGVDQGQLRERYLAMMKDAHPDRLSNLELPPFLLHFANDYSARLNEAYTAICHEKGWEMGSSRQ